jgi:formiminoglutamase
VAGGGKKIGYIQLSRSLDLGRQDCLWGTVWRGATARQLIENGVVDADNMAWVGPHGYVRAEEWKYAQELGLQVLTLREVRNKGIRKALSQALEVAAADCDKVYVSIDMEVLNGCYVAGTAVPSFDGLRDVELVDGMNVLRDGRVGAVAVVGVNPTIEFVYHTTQRVATAAILTLIGPRIAEVRTERKDELLTYAEAYRPDGDVVVPATLDAQEKEQTHGMARTGPLV